MLALDIKNTTKAYPGGTQALKALSLQVPAGAFMGLLGPNGAGKTTLIGILTSLVHKTSGEVGIFGFDLDRDRQAAKAMLGVVPQEFNCHMFETVEQIVINQAGYYGIPRAEAKARAAHYLDALQLWPKRKVMSRMLSGGMKRRLMIARALMHRPKLLILDEPTAGVDIEIRRQMWAFLSELNASGTTILLTTHYLEEAEQLCDRIAIIHQGQLLEDDRTEHLLAKLTHETLVLQLKTPLSKLPDAAPYVMRQSSADRVEVDVAQSDQLNDLFAWLSAQRIEVLSMKNKHNRLESFFLNRVGTSS